MFVCYMDYEGMHALMQQWGQEQRGRDVEGDKPQTVENVQTV